MKDREFLIWLHKRLEVVHKESPVIDYMHKLRAIIAATPKDKTTRITHVHNSLDDLQKSLDINKPARQ